MVTFFSVGSGDDATHFVVTDSAVPIADAVKAVRARPGGTAPSATRNAARATASLVGAAAGGWGIAWLLMGWREWPSFVLPAAAGALVGLAIVAVGRAGVARFASSGEEVRARARRPGAIVFVPEEIRRWAEAAGAPVVDVAQLVGAWGEAREAALMVELWQRSSSREARPRADAVVRPALAAECEARRAELDELAVRLGFPVPTDFPTSLDD
jgi:hypothetical protein